ncbi:hypothetical protein [Marinoscillum sp.]|uniref:hypothetical protein n=1 Tax=Marinoscillum sp. TaxID=2024838 RepID=UPI003BAD9E21
MEIHGVKRPLIATVEFANSRGVLEAMTSFDLSVADFDIDVPKLVIKNIAEVVQVKSSFQFKK